jgi:DNA-binding XRE family transcriptional regulator
MHTIFRFVQKSVPGDQRPVLLGSALRDARLGRRWTLEHVAERAGLSAAFLSRLERGKASSSLSNLIRLSSILDVPLERLFAATDRALVQGGYVVRRGSEGGALSGGVYRYKPLAGGLPHHAIWLFELEYRPGKGEECAAYSHEGEEVLYVLAGEIEFTIDGEPLSLRRGDCVQFDARQPHGGRNPGKGPARMLMIVAGHPAAHASLPFCAVAPGDARSPNGK